MGACDSEVSVVAGALEQSAVGKESRLKSGAAIPAAMCALTASALFALAAFPAATSAPTASALFALAAVPAAAIRVAASA